MFHGRIGTMSIFLTCFALIFFGLLFLSIFFTCLTVYIQPRKLHQILEDAEITNLTITDYNPPPITSSSSSSSMASSEAAAAALGMEIRFRVSSRNRNKRLGVQVWHMRIAAALDLRQDGLRRTELGRAYVVPGFLQLPRETAHLLTTPILVSGFNLSGRAAAALKAHVSSGFLPLRVYMKVRGQYKRVDGSWQTKVRIYDGTLYGDDKCGLNVSLSTTPNNNNNNASHLQGRQCKWSVSVPASYV